MHTCTVTSISVIIRETVMLVTLIKDLILADSTCILMVMYWKFYFEKIKAHVHGRATPN